MNKLIAYILLVFSGIFASCHSSKKTTVTKNPFAENDKEAQLSSLFIDACTNRLLGKFNEAEWYLKQCEKIEPNSAAVQYELSNLYRLMNRKQEALASVQKAVKLNPDNIWYHFALIKLYDQNNLYHKSIEELNSLIKKYPNNQDLYKQLVLEYELNNQPEKALKLLDEMEKKWGYDFDIMYEKVTLLYFMGKSKSVEAELKKYLQLYPDDLKAKEVLTGMFYKNKEYSKALDLAGELLSVDSLNSTSHLVYYDYYISQNNLDKAFYHLKKLFLNPDYEVKEKLTILIKLYSSSMKTTDTTYNKNLIDLCETFVNVHPLAPESHSIYADYLLKDGKKQQAITEYYKAAMLSKNKYAIWDQLLSLEYEEGMYDSLNHHSDLALEVFPNQAMFYVYKGIALRYKKEYEQAIQYYKSAIDYALDNNNLLEIIYTELAEIYNQMGNYSESDKYFENVLSINPDNALVLNNYAYYLALRKDKLDKAEKMIKKALDISPNNPNYIDTYAWVLYQQKKYKEAENILQTIIDKKASGVVLEHYGDVLFKLNKIDQALEYWKKAKEAGNNSDKLQKKIDTKTLED
ncbi:MAG TPA: tetratricopeptide repeat protein [Bacteroidia bacterium]|nr:tetratricopeptide repeat protein [Bacteroidia bacterium]